jgi:5-methylcytosine-specific restriction protein A
MSNRRAPGPSWYRSDFLRSPAWFARRDRWFRKQSRLGRPSACAVCGEETPSASLELHHLDYSGVTIVGNQLRAFERHDDLVPMHPSCHDLVHRLIDRDTVLANQRTRRDATAIAIARVREALITQREHK